MKKVFCETGNLDDWHRPIVKDQNGKSHVIVDGYPHPITDWGEPLYPIKEFTLLNLEQIKYLEEYFDSFTNRNLFDFLVTLKIISEDELFEEWQNDKTRLIQICLFNEPYRT